MMQFDLNVLLNVPLEGACVPHFEKQIDKCFFFGCSF